MGVDAIVGLVSLFGPKVIDIVKGIFSKKNTPEETINTLATTNPEAMTGYISALSGLIAARCTQFNMDITGVTPTWLAAWRGSIRPAVVTFAFLHIGIATILNGTEGITAIPEWWRYIYEIAIGSWFGDRWRTGL